LALPDKFACGGFEGVEDSGGAEGKDGSAGDGGCSPGASGAESGLVAGWVFAAPEFFTGGGVVAYNAFKFAALFLCPEA
jgi:hypothetical protein